MTILYIKITRAPSLENNGIQSSIKHTRHINIRYYFITDRIMKQEAYVELCPTLNMIGDYFTKALQGYQFFVLIISLLVSMKMTFPPIMRPREKDKTRGL